MTVLAIGFLALGLPDLASLPIHGRALVALTLIAPLAFLMGMPFPLGLGLVSDAAPGLAPWAWGVNGCASVVGAVLASLLALHIGFSGLLWAAIALYLAAGLTLSGRAAGEPPISHSPESV